MNAQSLADRPYSYGLLDEVADHFLQSAKKLLGALDRQLQRDEHFDAMQVILAAMPLTSAEYGVAANRLANSKSYANQGERGAAQYEVVALARGVIAALFPNREFARRSPARR